MKYDQNTGSNCFYTVDMAGSTLVGVSNLTYGFSNYSILYT